MEAVNTKDVEVMLITPIMKDVFDGKFIELDFSQNLAILPKLEVQSAHFSNKQYTLHCAIAKTFDKRYHCHLSHDRKHDGIFSDHVLRDLIINYNISNEALWAQKDKHLPNTRTNICLDFYSHWLTNLIQGSYTLWSCWWWQGSHWCDVKFWSKEYLKEGHCDTSFFLQFFWHSWVSFFKKSTVLLPYYSSRESSASLSKCW